MEEPRKGFPHWKEKASFQINELYGIIDLSDMIRRFSADCICQTIIHDKNSADYADGLFQYNLVDEMVLYTLRNHSIFRHDNFIGCFSADKIKMSARK